MASSISTPTTSDSVSVQQQVANKQGEPIITVLLIATWWGIFAGMVEGVGLLVFQRINFERWGPMVHVSKEIIWISPGVDIFLFVAIALISLLVARVVGQHARPGILVSVLAFLTVYDWLTLTERLTRIACVLLALGIAAAFYRWFKAKKKTAITFWKKSAVWLVGVWLLVFIAMQSTERLWERHQLAGLPAARPGAPNVLLIIVDTLRADHLSAYGYSRATTPNLDRLATQGVLFDNAISASSWTLPSHASLLTGRYPSEHGWENVQEMPWLGWGNSALHGYPTIGEALEREGYRTGAFSANQLYFTSNVGLGRGFIRFEDYFQSAQDMFLRTVYGRQFDSAYLHRTDKSKITRAIRWLGLTGLLDNRKRGHEVNREALAWIDHGQQPFFAVLNYIEAHDARSLRWARHRPRWGVSTEIDRYDSALSYVDAEIGDLVEQLDRRGLTRNTVIIFTGDHGEGLGQHDAKFHGIVLYREAIHVPLFVVYPGHVPTGVEIARPVGNAAIAATVMDIAGDQKKPVFPGPGLDVLWSEKNNQASWPDPISQLQKNGIDDLDGAARDDEPTAIDGDMESLVTPEWHLIHHEKLGDQLYDWVHDPGELRNLINTPEGREIAPRLAAKLQGHSAP